MSEQKTSDISSYPACVAVFVKSGGFLSQPEGQIVTTKSGQQYIRIDRFPKYGFYNNGRVSKPDGKMGSYSCASDAQGSIIVDGVNISSQYWSKEKGKYSTNYEKGEIKKAETVLNNLNPHTFLTIAQIGTAFIPVVGPLISAGIGLADAALYYKEGDNQSASITAVFSILPFVGKVISKIPGVKQLGTNGMAALSSKISKGLKLTPIETQVANEIANNSKLIQTELTSVSKQLSPLTKQINSLKPSYVARFGQDNYENLLREFLSGAADREYFIQALESAKKASPNLANFVTKFGIKFGKNEISQIQKVASELMDVNTGTNVILNTKDGPRTVKVFLVSKNSVQKIFPANIGAAEANMFADAAGGNIFMVKDNIEKLGTKQITDILTHEFAHIKDPSMVASPKYMKKYATEAVQGMKDWVEAQQLKDLGAHEWSNYKFDNAIKKYYLNPNEIIANNSMVLQSFATNTKNLGNVMNKNQILKGLDDVINFTKGNTSDLSKDAFKLLGYYDNNISVHFQRMATNPTEYRKFLSKIAQQADYLKSQVKIAM